MKKKINVFLIFISTCVFCHNPYNNESKMNIIQKVNIKTVDFSMTTIISVECDKYEEYLKGYDLFSITDSLQINKLCKLLNKLEPIDSNYSKTVDTRAKIELISSTDTNTICVGSLSFKKNNTLYKTPEELINFIEGLKSSE